MAHLKELDFTNLIFFLRKPYGIELKHLLNIRDGLCPN